MTEARELIIEVKGMTCDHCERSVAKALQSVRGVHEILEVSHAAAMARVMAAPEATAERIERAVEKAGYRARVNERSKGSDAPAGTTRRGGEFDLLVLSPLPSKLRTSAPASPLSKAARSVGPV